MGHKEEFADDRYVQSFESELRRLSASPDALPSLRDESSCFGWGCAPDFQVKQFALDRRRSLNPYITLPWDGVWK